MVLILSIFLAEHNEFFCKEILHVMLAHLEHISYYQKSLV